MRHRHIYYERDDGLAHCKICGGAEASLPMDCPGRRMTPQEEEDVSIGRMEFFAMKWWVERPDGR